MVISYQNTGQGLDDVMRAAFRIIYEFPARRRGFSEDDCGEFLLFFRPKLIRLVERFRYVGSSFDAYLCTTLKFQIKSYASAKSRAREEREVCELPDLWYADRTLPHASEPQEELPTAAELEREARSMLARLSSSRSGQARTGRRLIIYAVKMALSLTRADIRLVAKAAGVSCEWLLSVCDEARQRVAARRARQSVIVGRRNQAYVSLNMAQQKMFLAVDDGERSRIQHRLETAQARLRKAEAKVRKLPSSLTHAEIADLLAVPKGTVDSSIHYLRQSVERSRVAARNG
jgi:RNA polymerase sigma factor (sigma-70 family)